MKRVFPPDDQDYTYLQTNRSDDLGSIWSSMGIDLQSNLGTLRVAPRLRISTSTSDSANLGIPVAFEYFEGRYFAVCGTRVFFNSDSPNTTWTEDNSTGAATDYFVGSDLEIFDGRLWSTTATALLSKVSAAGAWTSRDSITGNTFAPLCYFRNVPGGRLYYTDNGHNIWSIDAANVVADSGDYSIDLGDVEITCMKATSTSIWVGIDQQEDSDANSDALIFQWDGISAQVDDTFPIKGATKVMAMVIKNSVPFVMDNNGILSKFTGFSFEEVGRLPFTTILPENDFMTMNGMIVTKDDTIQVFIDNQCIDNSDSIYENIPSGVWEWSEEFGFIHKNPVTYNTNAAPSTITDYGQNRISVAGALFECAHFEPQNSDANGQVLAGCTYFTNSSSTSSAIFFNDSNNTIAKKGYVVTTWMPAEEVQDKWERIYAVYRRFLDSGDSLVPKYRINEEDPTYATITWVNTTSFTTTTNITAYSPTATGFNGTQGGEVEVIQGTGSGSCVHITNISENGGTYTVTVDSAVTGVTTGTAKARFQKWILLNPKEAQGQINSYSQYTVGASNVRIQFKLCFTFKGNDEFYRLGIFSQPTITLES